MAAPGAPFRCTKRPLGADGRGSAVVAVGFENTLIGFPPYPGSGESKAGRADARARNHALKTDDVIGKRQRLEKTATVLVHQKDARYVQGRNEIGERIRASAGILRVNNSRKTTRTGGTASGFEVKRPDRQPRRELGQRRAAATSHGDPSGTFSPQDTAESS